MRVLQLMQNACGYFWTYMQVLCGLFLKSSGDVSPINLDVSIV